MTSTRYFSILASLVILVATTFASMANAQGYRIRSGDLLRVEVLEDSTINREVLVAPDGRISLPLAGNIRVSGASIPEAQRRVTDGLASNFATRPTVVVSLLQLRPDTVATPSTIDIYVIGEVNNPGMLSIAGGSTLLQALSQAGGFTDFAAEKRVQLRRVVEGRETVAKLNYKRVLNGEAGVALSEMQDGDVIVVPARRLFE
ncbi:polysaccharide biosynthesis/export family protein [Celeribacter neptunius]|uniref:Polysaccharide export outer membrane protein n=1 Tax=Celeribacter neptunius TaxID=588602 RepID=A0A1I3SAZ3_9RHOB|nr:polysaccharide biosynthesis/export family protein [Celeribacter neptunius]SFJ55908.1 polysaccharide export outer membrane protein [Celeribacter neptunius]